MPRSQRADQMEAILRQADASFEKWFRAAKKRGAGILRQRVDNLQGGLKKLSTGLGQVERERPVVAQSEEPAKEKNVAPSKRRARPAVAPKPSASRKRKKAA